LPTQLVYRASRDGWTAAEINKAIIGRTETLILVSVQNSDRIFGMYTAVAWPPNDCERARSRRETGPRSSRSFFFSLVNGRGRPLRFVLNSGAKAVETFPKKGPRLGPISLMFEETPANQPESNEDRGIKDDGSGRRWGFSLDDEWEAAERLTKPDFTCSIGFFSGSGKFACAEIEVFQMQEGH
jgi:hypothetical protein